MYKIQDKLDLLENEEIDIEVYKYIGNVLKDLYINLDNKDYLNIMDLFNKNKLKGFSFESSMLSILFFLDKDNIVIGKINYNDNEKEDYLDIFRNLENLNYHAWIEFEYLNNLYVFDPSLSLINSKELYYKIFEPTNNRIINKKNLYKKVLNYLKKDNNIMLINDINDLLFDNKIITYLESDKNNIKLIKANYNN